MIRVLLLVFALAMLVGGASAQSATQLPPDSEYVTVRDGHLNAGGQRVRLWCVIGGFPNFANIEPGDDEATRKAKRDRAYRDAEALIDRFALLGFNGMRLWEKPSGSYTKGDGSRSDVLDYFVSLAKAKGFRIWLPSVSTTRVRPDDASLVNDPATESAWKEAVAKTDGSGAVARVWDPRLEAAQVRHMKRIADHVNQHTGLRWGDDPVFAIWELTNEEWWMIKMVRGNWQSLPEFFRASLSSKWHEYLKGKYKSEDAIRAKWGFLLPGESLAGGTIQIAPLAGEVEQDLSGMDPQARLQVEQARAAGQSKWSRDDFNRHRGADVMEFFMTIQLAHKNRLKDALKAMGKSTRMGPVVYDTGIGYEIQSQFLHQNAEAVAHDAYINGVTQTKENQRFPWYSGLEEWPRIAQDVPWLEHNRVEGKPYLCYETQIMQPAKYRVEFPYRLLALAAIQDWDAICWHYWGSVPHISSEPKPFDRAMDMTTGWHPQGYHYTYDALQNSAMRAAAYAFRSGALRPALSPTKFIYGRKSLYDPASMDYAGSYGKIGKRMLPTTYRYGVRIHIDPTREDDEVQGPTIDPLGQGLPNVVPSTPEILFDVARGGLTMDSPSAAGFTGFMQRFGTQLRFKNGVTLSNVSIAIPAEMPYKDGIAEERYIGFMLVSRDGKPLAESASATLSLKSTSFNTGFKLLMTEDSLSEGGSLPVLEARVAATVTAKAIAGMTARFLGWHGETLGTVKVGADGVLRIPSDKPIWVVDLTR